MIKSPLTFQHAQHLILALIAGMMAFHLFVYVVYAVELMRFPFDYDQGEGFELLDAVYLSEGRLPYQDSAVYPYYSSNYPPLFRLLLAPMVWLFGPEYWYGRLLSFVGTLITVVAIAYAIQRQEKRWEIGVLLGLSYVASNYIYHIGPLFRQQYFMVMFETLAVVALANVFTLPADQQRRRLWWGLGLLLLAGYTKQLAASTCVAVFIWLALQNPRRAILYGLGFGAIAGVIFLALDLATGHQWWLNVIGANVNQYIFSQFTGLLRQFVELHWVLLLFALLMAFYELYFARLSLYSVWFVVSFASTYAAGKWGAGDSYFATTIAGACILAGLFIARTLNQSWTLPDNYLSRRLRGLLSPLQTRYGYPVVGLACLGLLLVYSLAVVKIPTSGPIFEPLSQALGVSPKPGHRYPLYDAAGWTPGYATIGHLPSQTDHDNGWRIVERMRQTDLPIMSEEAGFSLRAGKEVIGNPTQLKNLYENEMLDPALLVAQIENQELGMVIFRARFYPEPVLAAVDDAYYAREVIPMNGFEYQLWYPEPTWAIRRPIRDFLEAPIQTQLEVPLPTGLENPAQWINEMMGRWAWVRASDSAVESPDCQSYFFTRRSQQTNILICGQKLLVNAPIEVE
jgi:hypothetical protein